MTIWHRLWQYGFALFAVLFLGASQAQAEKRALVFGVSTYENYQNLPNAGRDADLIADRLQSIGFSVQKFMDANSDIYHNNVTLTRDDDEDGVLFIYFAGHGVQVLGENFLLFRDVSVSPTKAVGAVPLSALLERYSGLAENVVVVLDSCRDNPLGNFEAATTSFVASYPEAYGIYNQSSVDQAEETARSASEGQGLGRVDVQPPNVLLAYATRAGSVSYDGPEGANSPFAAALADSVSKPDIEITRAFREVRDRVLAATGGRQEPFIYGSLGSQDLYLNPEDCPCERASVVPPEVRACQAEAAPATEGFPFGRDVPAINPVTAIPACEAALDRDPSNPMLHFWAGRAYSAARDDERARDHYLVAAQSDVSAAMHNLAKLYNGGRDFGLDAEKAFYWYEQASNAGEPLSRTQLAWFYETGRAGVTDLEKAFALYHANAEAGETFSQRKLGYLYKLGLGVEASPEASLDWFSKAAANGDMEAMNELAAVLVNREGGEDMQQGLGWLILSWANGSPDAGRSLEAILNAPAGDPKLAGLIERIVGHEVAMTTSAADAATALRAQINTSWLVDLRHELLAAQVH